MLWFISRNIPASNTIFSMMTHYYNNKRINITRFILTITMSSTLILSTAMIGRTSVRYHGVNNEVLWCDWWPTLIILSPINKKMCDRKVADVKILKQQSGYVIALVTEVFLLPLNWRLLHYSKVFPKLLKEYESNDSVWSKAYKGWHIPLVEVEEAYYRVVIHVCSFKHSMKIHESIWTSKKIFLLRKLSIHNTAVSSC